MLCYLSGEGKTKKSVILLSFILLFTVFTIPPQTRIRITNAEILYVGSGQNYSAIQDAINNASSGDIIFIFNGVYYETINITKNDITLEGENKENTIIDGTSSSIENSTVLIDKQSNITIKNFKIRNSNKHGIYAQQANNIEITNCEIYDNLEHGINCYVLENLDINGNVINDNYNDGVHLIGTTIGNIYNCNIYDNYQTGVFIDSSNKINITDSIIENNDNGIILDDYTNNIEITYCNIKDNNVGLSINSYCINNEIYLNNFYLNYQNSVSNEINIWDNGFFGNYWHDYVGDDYDSNGIGDTAYTMYGVNDSYPLVHMYGSVINQDIGKIFLTIQAAIDDADTISGNTIFVKEDIYYENILISKDDITIQGENKLTTIIDASNKNMNGILIKNHDYVTIEGFTITNSPASDIYNSNGVFIWAYAPLSGNNHSNHNKINDCIIKNNGFYGNLLYASNDGQSTNSNVISNCEIFENGYSGIRITNDYEGGFLSNADSNTIINCEIYDNGYNGYQDYETSGLSISAKGCVTNTTISDCTFYYSIGYDIFISAGELVENNSFYQNNFLSEIDNVFDKGNNIWYNITLENGNYWRCYDEPSEGAFDNNSDGVIDSPYNVPDESNQDLYPLVNPIDLFYPVAQTNGPYTAYVNQSIVFDASNSYDPDGVIISYKWDLGNNIIKADETFIYAYSKSGKYTVKLTVEDEYGLKDTYTTTVTIKKEITEPEEPVNIAPEADAGGPYYEFVGNPVFFDGSDSFDPDGTNLIFKWNFGDGNTSSVEMPTHTYLKEGNYSIKLTVTDEDGATDNATTFALITKKPNNPPDKPKIFGANTGHINTTCNYTINGSDPDDDKIQYVVNWSDAANETVSAYLNNSTAFNTSHNWSTGGVYVIKVYSVDENNASSDIQQFKVLIDAYYCGSLGYLIDKNGDGVYDVFYREQTGKETSVERNNSEYNIDINGDYQWEYIYNFTTNTIMIYPSALDESIDNFSIETKWIFLMLIICSFLVIAMIKILIYLKKKNKQKFVKKNIKEVSYYINKSSISTSKEKEQKLEKIENIIDNL